MSYAMTWGAPPSNDDRLFAALAHASVYVSTFVGPLLFLLVFNDKSRFIRYHAIQALVFQGILWLAVVMVKVVSALTCGVGALLFIPLGVFALLPIWAAIRGFNGAWSGFPGLESVGRG